MAVSDAKDKLVKALRRSEHENSLVASMHSGRQAAFQEKVDGAGYAVQHAEAVVARDRLLADALESGAIPWEDGEKQPIPKPAPAPAPEPVPEVDGDYGCSRVEFEGGYAYCRGSGHPGGGDFRCGCTSYDQRKWCAMSPGTRAPEPTPDDDDQCLEDRDPLREELVTTRKNAGGWMKLAGERKTEIGEMEKVVARAEANANRRQMNLVAEKQAHEIAEAALAEEKALNAEWEEWGTEAQRLANNRWWEVLDRYVIAQRKLGLTHVAIQEVMNEMERHMNAGPPTRPGTETKTPRTEDDGEVEP